MQNTSFPRSLTWSPTVALSWLWGLGFFYAIHVTLTYGWIGFAAFAASNVSGLFLFGWLLGAPGREPSKIMESLRGPYSGIFLLCQIGAVAITLFAFSAYLWTPMMGGSGVLPLSLLVLFSCAAAHALPLARLRILHIAYLVVGAGAGLVALGDLAAGPAAPATGHLDGVFCGLLLPTIIGFLLGPWADVQQWQRVIEMRRDGCSPRVAYTGGALIFLGLLCLNAFLASFAGIDGTLAADGHLQAQPSVAFALASAGTGWGAAAYTIWGLLAAASTIDSFYLATRWHLKSVTDKSMSPLLALIPAGAVTSPLGLLAVASAASWALLRMNVSQVAIMMPYATVLIAGTGCLLLESLGGRRRYDPALCYMLGVAAAIVFLSGYLGGVSAFLALAPLIALLGVLPTLGSLIGKRSVGPVAGEVEGAVPAPSQLAARVVPLPAKEEELFQSQGENSSRSFGFEDQWFVMHTMPTYDDTNSVGNVYFANYVRWIGKARELFFNVCMPDFDLKSTNYYVLTRSFQHEFRREAAEFEPVKVRIRIAGHNRKFVTLSHEIYSEEHGMLGRGEQSLMFVDTSSYRPLDIPGDIIRGFLPYWPTSSPHNERISGKTRPVEQVA